MGVTKGRFYILSLARLAHRARKVTLLNGRGGFVREDWRVGLLSRKRGGRWSGLGVLPRVRRVVLAVLAGTKMPT